MGARLKELVEKLAPALEKERLARVGEFWKSEAIRQHATFWRVLRDHLHH